MQRIQIDGVPVFHVPGPRRTTMSLVFGVGTQDETYATRQVTHLVEHLVMGSLPKSSLQSNAMTTVDSTHFHATGRPEAVAAFVEGVCAALDEFPLDRVEAEIGVLLAEDCAGGGGLADSLWAARYGLTGPGLAHAPGPGPEFLDDEVVRGHARRWFVRGNVALLVLGDLPAGLRLHRLPEGSPPAHPAAVRRPQEEPSWTKSWTPGVGLQFSASGAWSAALRVGAEVLCERVHDVARAERGLSYSASVSTYEVDAQRREVAVLVDARDGQEAAVARILWEQYRALCEQGPEEHELEHVVAAFEEEIDTATEEELAAVDLEEAVRQQVRGLPFLPVRELARQWRAVTPQSARGALRAVRPAALLQVPEWCPVEEIDPELRRSSVCGLTRGTPTGRTVRPVLARRLRRTAGPRELVLGEHALSLRDADGDLHTIAWAQVESVFPLAGDAGLAVAGSNLCLVPVEAAVFGRRGVEQVRAHLRDRVPPARWSTPRTAGADVAGQVEMVGAS